MYVSLSLVNPNKKTLPCHATISASFEWAMKNFSSAFHLPAALPAGQESSKESEQKDEGNQGDHHQEETPPAAAAARCEWDLSLSSVVSSNAAVSDTLGVIEFDPSNTIFATGGIARKIRIYTLSSLLPLENIRPRGEQRIAFLDHVNMCDYYICTPAKLSSLRWRPESGGRVLGSGDYDGVVMEYDLESKLPTFERDEHGGKRVWSVDYSHRDPFLGASGSDDGTMQMWDTRCSEGGGCVAKVQPTATGSSVCCVEFNPFRVDAMVAAGCADKKAYSYDVRKMAEAINVFDGHTKTVTYVRFLDAQTMVSAATDGCLKLWNIDDSRLIRTYKGHVNSRSFVGLSVWRHGGLLGCGSEDNQVFVYDKRWGKPIWVHGFEPMARPAGSCGHGFVSSVCWRQVHEDQCTLLAGGSNGVLQVFVGKKKSLDLLET